ncbi:bifunctional phosphoribosylaminoimidazolecarboxamide formyltransferase/IMP cyclohydrolase [uncultured Agrococcus sp.]|uniref:bifunctional phosphoribosylaminoimidazolecarboxamide formyltransferase/IMP cyclohydrolase n=1 Tax=uncultured Agrococcus sp. TaxID=382258 RepID=UPI0025F63DB6|nr:bifunctional phosphoribosylaminoimidazolecarboxamide formyltransferase/IMP cyclohydrolase [uncultured Agrococcus sp.]
MSGPTHDASLYRERDVIAPKRALISVSDKNGVTEFAAALAADGVQIVSTGSTAKLIAASGTPVTEVADVTGFPEVLDGRVKTLHPSVHAGILADLRLASHEEQLQQLGIEAFDMVVVNLYPFVATVRSGASANDTVEQIDIGGPAMVRAAAKNFANVAIVTNPEQYASIVASLGTGLTLAQRRELSRAAFAHTAEYDSAVAEWFTTGTVADVDEAGGGSEPVPGADALLAAVGSAQPVASLRYGENSHQEAAVYALPGGEGIVQARQLHGKEMSYNNFQDADAALRAAFDFAEPAVAIIKHAQPCGIAVADAGAEDAIASAHRRAHECDPVSAFGGVIAANRVVTRTMADAVKDIFTEVIVAPGYEDGAVELLQSKKNIRILELPEGYARESAELRQVSGGVLVQQPDAFDDFTTDGWQLVAGDAADAETLRDLAFAWRAVRSVKSNAILLAADGASVGVGMGQVNRVDSCNLAVARAGERARGSVAASDAFFPFADGPQILLDAGVRAIVQPGGSVRDEEVVEAARAAGVTMYFTGERHFFH